MALPCLLHDLACIKGAPARLPFLSDPMAIAVNSRRGRAVDINRRCCSGLLKDALGNCCKSEDLGLDGNGEPLLVSVVI